MLPLVNTHEIIYFKIIYYEIFSNIYSFIFEHLSDIKMNLTAFQPSRTLSLVRRETKKSMAYI